MPRVAATPVILAKKSAWLLQYRFAAAVFLIVALTALITLSRSARPHVPSTAAVVKRAEKPTARTVVATAAPKIIHLAAATRRDVPAAVTPVAVTSFVLGDRAAAAPSADRLLAEVSTMDLTMPIAEPDLDIESRHSLWAQIGKTYGIDPLLLYSVALVESKALYPDGTVAPTPWLFRVNDRLVRGDRQHVQMQMAAASQFGSAVQDVGIMQVYYPMHRDAVRDPLALLDPRTNITVAAKILRDGMHETRDRVLGVGYYHSHTPDLARDYGTAVLAVYGRLKANHRATADRGRVVRSNDVRRKASQLAALHPTDAARI